MGRPTKTVADRERQSKGSSQGSSSESRHQTGRSTPKSIPRLDGNRDPTINATDYTDPRDLKNLSEFLGAAGWYAARGVSHEIPLF